MATTTTLKRYRTKPLEVDAMCFEGELLLCHGGWDGRYPDDWAELRDFMNGYCPAVQVGTVPHGGPNQFLPFIHTREGFMVVRPGEWVVCVAPGEYLRRTPGQFNTTYEIVEEDGGA
jgi:hypothetical protein